MTPDAANDKITITVPGIYKAVLSNSVASGTPDVTFFGSLLLGRVEQDQCHWTRKSGGAGDVGSESLSGEITVTAPADLDFRVRHDDLGSVDFTVSYANLSVKFLGKT